MTSVTSDPQEMGLDLVVAQFSALLIPWTLPLQITIARIYPDSEEEKFFTCWDHWRNQLGNYEVEGHLSWITGDACHPTKDVIKKVHPGVRGEKVIYPHYTSHRISLTLASKNILDYLWQVRESLELEVMELSQGYTPVSSSKLPSACRCYPSAQSGASIPLK